MYFLLPVLILSADLAPSTEQQHAETVYTTGFEEATDKDFDAWPDDWTRRRGRGYPQYIEISLVDDPEPRTEPSRCLRIELDGGGATVYSPPIPMSPVFSYSFEGFLKTEHLRHDEAYFTVTFYTMRTVLRKNAMPRRNLPRHPHGQRVRIGPVAPVNEKAEFAVIGLHLMPTVRSDLYGAAMFDDLRLARLPRMAVQTSQPHNLYDSPNDVAVTCEVSGIEQRDPELSFELFDVHGNLLATQTKVLAIEAKDQVGDADHLDQPPSRGGFSGTLTWRPPIPGTGFYRIRVSMYGESDLVLQRTMSLAVMPQMGVPTKSEFGWCMPRGEDPLAANELVGLLATAGVKRIKFPVWHDVGDKDAIDGVAAFADRLSAQGIEVVGVLDKPPEEVREMFGNREHLTVAEVFTEPDMWRPSIDPLLIRLSLKIQYWQLGADEDSSFIDLDDLEQTIQGVRTRLKQFGQRTRLGLAWRWVSDNPPAADPPWDFLALTESPSFTESELQRYANEMPATGVGRWVTLRPLPEGSYDVSTRPRSGPSHAGGQDRQHGIRFLRRSFRQFARTFGTRWHPVRHALALVHHGRNDWGS